MWLINYSKDNCIFLHQILSICILLLLLWLHYVFPFPMLMSVRPGTGGGGCFQSVTIFIERYKRQTDSVRAREQLFVLLIARNKSCGSSNRRWLLCDVFPYSWEEKLFCVSCCTGESGCVGVVNFICFWWCSFYPLNISSLKIGCDGLGLPAVSIQQTAQGQEQRSWDPRLPRPPPSPAALHSWCISSTVTFSQHQRRPLTFQL